ncbi:phosphonate ABC transporter ATP-binding protein [Achromobacter insolitus]|uniref:phosphonate ABC transporter ATP-binding protein n=1 Tax=Achromobacter insolitus TaxID=217204 RepID=UPI001EED074F|nr:phosphonate ABC transporter ATP-binding protein [Achromobacter insolitus]
MLRYQSVGMRYADGTAALDSVSLRVPRGQFCVILGASGAGKSTLLRMANGLTTPTQGEVWVDGRQVQASTLAALRPRIGMVHQHFNLVSRATVATNVLSGALPGLPAWRAYLMRFPAELRERACQLVREVGLQPEHLQRRVSELSGGQQQRVGIARAFMLAPALLLADEPVASLDPRISRDILELLRNQARERGATVLCSLHQVDLAREFADRIVALRHGVMVFDGPASQFDEAAARALYQAARAEIADVSPGLASPGAAGPRIAPTLRPVALSAGGV